MRPCLYFVLEISKSKQSELLKKINGKIQMVIFTWDDTQRILDENELNALGRHEEVFVDLVGKKSMAWRSTSSEQESRMKEKPDVRKRSVEMKKQIAVFEGTMDIVKKVAKNLPESSRK